MRVVSALCRTAVAFARSAHGGAAVWMALSMLPVAVLGGGAVDVHRMNTFQARLQDAVDAATLAGARDGDAGSAERVFDGSTFAGLGSVAARDFSASQGVLQGAASGSVPTAFLGLIGVNTMHVAARSSASMQAASAAAGGPCVYVLDQTANQAFLVNSGANIRAPGCEIHVRSTANPAAIYNSGSVVDTRRVCIAGARIIDNGGTHPNTQTNCQAASDPYAGRMPANPANNCQFNNGNYNGGTINLQPGVYCGWFNFNSAPTVNFAPGVYVIRNGGWNVNGGAWTGQGVTFFFDDTSKIQFNSGIAANLSAPASGAWQGVLFAERPGLSRSQFVLNDSRGNRLTGLIYLPSRDVTYNSGSDVQGDQITMVFNTLIVNATDWRLQSSPIPVGGVGGAVASSPPRLLR